MGLVIPEIIKPSHAEAVNNPALWQEFKELCHELELPCPSAIWRFQVVKDDKVIHEHTEMSGSWLRSMYNWITCSNLLINCNHASTFGAGYINMKNTAGTINGSTTLPLTIYYHVNNDSNTPTYATQNSWGFRAGDGNDNYGILVGTDDTAVTFDDYTLIAQVANGNGAGQLAHQGMNAPTRSWTAGTLTFNFNWFRYFNNNSGGDITIYEVGLIAYARAVSASSYYLFERHVIALGLEIPDTAQLKCEYDIPLVYPE